MEKIPSNPYEEELLKERCLYQKLKARKQMLMANGSQNYHGKQFERLAPYLQLSQPLYRKILEEETTNQEIQDFNIPPHCVPINMDVRDMNWRLLRAVCDYTQEIFKRKQVGFQAIVMDPPWQLASANPTRGVALGYSQLSDKDIEEMAIDLLASEGFLFLWTINAKYVISLELMKKWGYKFVDEITWVKQTINHKLAKSHGYYLQHAKESCLVGIKGDPKFNNEAKLKDVIFSLRRGQSQKPAELYDLIEKLIPNGRFLEIFGRKNNLRNGWTTIGNETVPGVNDS